MKKAHVFVRFGLGLFLLVILAIAFTGCGGCYHIMNSAESQSISVDAQKQSAEQRAKMANEANKTKQIAELQKQIANMQRQINDIARVVEKANGASEALLKVAQAPVVPTTNPVVMRVLESPATEGDMVLHMWTGKPAVLHELNTGKSTNTQPRVEPSAQQSERRRRPASEKDIHLRDRIKDLQNNIDDTELSITIRKNHMSSAMLNSDMRACLRKQIKQFEDEVVENQQELTVKLAELTEFNQIQ